ncbi:MAG: acetyltransferase [Rikenellaceae bacterium]|nr:acetyltransferase [Rikenellaceae bacterium]
MYLYGASGHAKVIIEILEACGTAIDGLWDDYTSRTELLGYPVKRYNGESNPTIISIGNNQIRQRIASQLECEWGCAVHPSAIVSKRAQIGCGTVVMHGAIIQADAKIGQHAIINTGATIDHECVVGDFAHISPNATLCGNVTVGEGTHIGAGAVVIPGITIGKWSTIGAGAVVINDVPDNVVVVGNPAKLINNNTK